MALRSKGKVLSCTGIFVLPGPENDLIPGQLDLKNGGGIWGDGSIQKVLGLLCKHKDLSDDDPQHPYTKPASLYF